ncbi:excalibur calcium-binding domain-containing protein [Solibacillus sp. FSL R5-0691]|uniref:excalibur calcium-binding domain-containing protein n=1 Tax=unclassified Solibacillus TaxID=2637870 RepID=UPI0030D17BE7
MKKYISGLLMGAVLISGFSFSTMEAEAATKVKAVAYKNCTELNKVYKGGVAKDAKTTNKGGKTKYKPFVSAELYKLNAKSDRDKDGIACEK